MLLRRLLPLLVVLAAVAMGCSGDEESPIDRTDLAAATRTPEPPATTTTAPSAQPPGGEAVEALALPRATRAASPHVVESIRDIDFLNGFTYATGLEYVAEATVRDGVHETGEPRTENYFWFGVTDVDYGDLDGDGREEAIVATSWNGGGTGFFDEVIAYRLVNGRAVEWGRVAFGDRGDGGVQGVQIVDGVVLVRTFGTTLGACCPNEITEVRLVLGEAKLTVGDRGPARTWLSSGSSVREVRFLPGTSSAVLGAYGSAEQSFGFEATAGQRLVARPLDGALPARMEIVAPSGLVLPADESTDAIALPEDGDYELVIVVDGTSGETALVELAIGDPDPTITWTPMVGQHVVTRDPFVYTSLVWPHFESDEPGTAAANTALADFVAGLDDYWIEDVTEYSEPQGDSSYEVSYTVTHTAGDLVSVRFNDLDYVCCRPYPGYSPHAATVDLAAGRIIEPDEIVDLSRSEDLVEAWLVQLEADTGFDRTSIDESYLPIRFASIAIVADGIEFGTARGALGGGTPGTLTVVTFDELGSLVRPQVLERLGRG